MYKPDEIEIQHSCLAGPMHLGYIVCMPKWLIILINRYCIKNYVAFQIKNYNVGTFAWVLIILEKALKDLKIRQKEPHRSMNCVAKKHKSEKNILLYQALKTEFISPFKWDHYRWHTLKLCPGV